jgi:hypothetical protein
MNEIERERGCVLVLRLASQSFVYFCVKATAFLSKKLI